MSEADSYNTLQIGCPNCGHEFSLSSAVLSQVREQAKAELHDSFADKQAAANLQLKEAKELRESLRKQEDALRSLRLSGLLLRSGLRFARTQGSKLRRNSDSSSLKRTTSLMT